MTNDPIAIVGAKRTPCGNMLGNLSSLTASELGAIAHQAALEQAGLAADSIDEVITGCVLQAGQGQAPARQAALRGGLPNSTPATTINKMCGSGMKAVMFAADSIRAGSNEIVLASGMESMSNAPYLLPKARSGYRLGHASVKDHMFLDGLEDAYDKGQLMGCFAEQTASHFEFSRQMQDDFAIQSLRRALSAQESGAFDAEITPVEVKLRKSTETVTKDEGPCPSKLEKITKLKPAFDKDGTVTAANSSSISDGACSLILMPLSKATQLSIAPLAVIRGQSAHANEPQWFTTAPIGAIEKVLQACQWSKDEVDLYEINEAFAVVTMAAQKELALSADKVNVNGGACALGHPIGASGARILCTLLYALKNRGLKKGVAALCIGGGEATAVAIECL